jgi:parallel beta-helix repeat protein
MIAACKAPQKGVVMEMPRRGLRRLVAGLAVVAAGGLGAPTSAGPVLYVDDDALPGGDGACWTSAHRFLQDALVPASIPGSGVVEIRVAQGAYLPDRDALNPLGTGDRDATFQLVNGVALRGGFAGAGAPDPDQRDVVAHETTLSGDLDGNDLPGFVNIDENSYTVVTGSNTDATAVLDGFTVIGGNSSVTPPDDGSITGQFLGGGMFTDTGTPSVITCTFTANIAYKGGGIYNYMSSPFIADCTFAGNTTTEGQGGGIRNYEYSHPLITGCAFVGNSASAGGSIANEHYSEPTVLNCAFVGNSADGGGGGIASIGRIEVRDCTFTNNTGLGAPAMIIDEGEIVNCLFADNEAESAAGAFGNGWTATLVNCVFERNTAGWYGGGMISGGDGTLVNCTFSRNVGVPAGAMYVSTGATLINCTLSDNDGGGIMVEDQDGVSLANCVVWGNGPFQLAEDPDFPGGPIMVANSDVEGGWPGPGNIDADPWFVQPGTDNLRLSFGSPCVNAGDDAALPPDEFDLDNDGNTSEPIPVDLDGNPRSQAGAVDMGAYEGEFEPMDPAAAEGGFDQGEGTILVPAGDTPDPLQNAMVFVVNTSGPDNATFTVTQVDWAMHPEAAGYTELSCILSLDTTLADGVYLATLFIPFDSAGLGPVDPAQVNLTRYDPDVGNWSLVVTSNFADSPGYDGPVGDRVLSLEGGAWGVTNEIGDYGVYWNPASQQGFAWANVDVARDFGLGVALCPADCLQTPDGEVSIVDFLALLRRWGESSWGSPCDIDADGVIGQQDVLDLLQVWGPCPPPAMAAGERPVHRMGRPRLMSRSPDLDGNALVGRADLAILRAAWGPCDDCPADLDSDGRVGNSDLLRLLAAWGPAADQGL